jgi:KaiC/GvpD/RAD55 family RecA-like ATPase
MTPSSPLSAEHHLILLCLQGKTLTPLMRRGFTQDTFISPDCKAAWTFLVKQSPSGAKLPTLGMFYRHFPGFPHAPAHAADTEGLLADMEVLADGVWRDTVAARSARLFQEALTSLAAGADPFSVLRRADTQMGSLRPSDHSSPLLLHTAGPSILEDYARREQCQGVVGVPFAHEVLNRCFGGKTVQSVYVVAGHTGSGKSWFLLNEAYTDWLHGYRVIVVLGEMSKAQAARRIVMRHARISASLYNRGLLSPEDKARLEERATSLLHTAGDVSPSGGVRELKILDRTDGRNGLPPSVKQVKAMAAEWGADIVYYDSVYKATDSTDPKDQAVIAGDVLTLAVAGNIPVVISTQTNSYGVVAFSTMYERDATGILNVSVGDSLDGSGKALAVEVAKVRDEGEFCPPFALRFDPGVSMDYMGPVDLHLFRKARQDAEASRGRYAPQGTRASATAVPAPTKTGPARPGPIRE